MRQIDADALKAQIEDFHCKGCDNYNFVRCRACWVDDTLSYLEEAPTVGGWISVNERLPEKPGRYLVCTSTITKVAWFLLSLKANPQFEYEMQGEPDRPGFFNGDSEGDWVQDDVTHWMVLPERPKEDE